MTALHTWERVVLGAGRGLERAREHLGREEVLGIDLQGAPQRGRGLRRAPQHRAALAEVEGDLERLRVGPGGVLEELGGLGVLAVLGVEVAEQQGGLERGRRRRERGVGRGHGLLRPLQRYERAGQRQVSVRAPRVGGDGSAEALDGGLVVPFAGSALAGREVERRQPLGHVRPARRAARGRARRRPRRRRSARRPRARRRA